MPTQALRQQERLRYLQPCPGPAVGAPLAVCLQRPARSPLGGLACLQRTRARPAPLRWPHAPWRHHPVSLREPQGSFFFCGG
eukprot:181788-Hanusia_phi.AAC.8